MGRIIGERAVLLFAFLAGITPAELLARDLGPGHAAADSQERFATFRYKIMERAGWEQIKYDFQIGPKAVDLKNHWSKELARVRNLKVNQETSYYKPLGAHSAIYFRDPDLHGDNRHIFITIGHFFPACSVVKQTCPAKIQVADEEIKTAVCNNTDDHYISKDRHVLDFCGKIVPLTWYSTKWAQPCDDPDLNDPTGMLCGDL